MEIYGYFKYFLWLILSQFHAINEQKFAKTKDGGCRCDLCSQFG